MLRADVVAACAAGRFHIYSVDTIQEALRLFSGCEAGERGEDGHYPEGSLLARAVEKAHAYWLMAISTGVESGPEVVEEVVEEEGEEDALLNEES